MLGRAPESSLWCAQGDHERCPHRVGMRVAGLWRLRPRPEVVLCNDPWHRSRNCPLVGRRKAAQDVWSADCTYPGAEDSRRSFARSHERRREMDAVMADVDLADHPNAETVERRLRDALVAHGKQPPPGLPGMSRLEPPGLVPEARGSRGRSGWPRGPPPAAFAARGSPTPLRKTSASSAACTPPSELSSESTSCSRPWLSGQPDGGGCRGRRPPCLAGCSRRGPSPSALSWPPWCTRSRVPRQSGSLQPPSPRGCPTGPPPIGAYRWHCCPRSAPGNRVDPSAGARSAAGCRPSTYLGGSLTCSCSPIHP
jgi:hypothetical protein